MELLEAVNTVLPYLGEHTITNVENTSHPTVALIVAALERHRKTLLIRGWWFNELTQTIPVNTNGRIDIPVDTITAYGLDCSVSLDGEWFYDLVLGTRYFTKPIKVKLVRDIPFDRLPEQAALYLTYTAAHSVYAADFGADNVLEQINNLAGENFLMLTQENLRNRRYNNRTVALRNSTYHSLRWR